MRSTPSPNPFDRLMGWLRLSRGEGPAWEGWARRACPPVLCSVFVFKRNLLRVSFHSAERFDCAKGRASRDLGPVAQIICGACGTGWGWGWRAQTRRSLATRREMRALYHSPRRNGRRDRIHPSLRFCVQDLVASFAVLRDQLPHGVVAAELWQLTPPFVEVGVPTSARAQAWKMESNARAG